MGWCWCPSCQARVPRLREPYCEKCGIPTSRIEICEKCQKDPPAYRMLRSWAVFDSPVQDGLHALKYRGNMAIGEGFALQMVDFVRSLPWKVDLVIPMPLGKQRLKERGYNQVAVVAQPLAYFAELAYAPNALWKSRETRSQVGLNIQQRRQNVQNIYQADPKQVRQKSVLLMDDVATTGSTISSSTEALLSAGAREVYAITIARALSHHSLNRV